MKERKFCSLRGRDNQNSEWRSCPYCCAFCEDKDKCNLALHCRTLSKEKAQDCSWICDIVEFMLIKLFPNTWKDIHLKRRREKWIRSGHRKADGSWEGELLKSISKKEYEELIRNFGKK